MSLLTHLFDYIEGLTLTQGRFAGQPFRLHGWEKRFIRGAFSTDGDAGLSVARGNGKSTLIAGICCAALDGPLVVPHAQTVVAASSFDQGKIIFDHVLAFMGDKLSDRKRWRLQDSTNRAIITCRQTGASVKCIGSDPRRMHGLAPRLLIGDELAQWEPGKIDKALAALQTSMGKIESARAIWIGTRADMPDHPFEKMLNGGCEYVQVYSAPREAPPFQRRTWKRANPGLDQLPDLEATIRREAKRANRDAQAMASFRALRLNQGVSDTVEDVLLSAEVWREIETEGLDQSGQYVLGLDLGQNTSMSAAAAFWYDTGGLDCFACFPETPHLLDRGLADGVGALYAECADRGELIQAGLKVSDLAALLTETLRRWGPPVAIVCDRWREAELRQVLVEIQYPSCQLAIRGMGFLDGGQDVREFRAACLDGYVKPVRSLLLRSAMLGARVATDPAGNSKLNKGGFGRKMRVRDDAVAASILAVAEGRRRAKAEAQRQPFSHVLL